jgi:predicted nucleotidyltransferase
MELSVPLKYRSDIENATRLLKNEGCSAVYLFGSLVTGKTRDGSDIDIGVRGLAPRKFFRMYGKLQFGFENKIDLVDFDDDDNFYLMLNNLGEVVQIG